MKYFAMIEGDRIGPMEIDRLVEAGLRPDDYVWRKGMADWIPAREDAEICRHFRRRLHDRLHPVAPAPEYDVAAEMKNPEEATNYAEVRTRIIMQADEENISVPPVLCPSWLIILSFLFFFPLALIALRANRIAARAWEAHEGAEAHDAARRAKLFAGVAVCLGIMIWATVIRLL